MRDIVLLAVGYFFGAVVAPWLRRQVWFDATTSRISRFIDRLAGHR